MAHRHCAATPSTTSSARSTTPCWLRQDAADPSAAAPARLLRCHILGAADEGGLRAVRDQRPSSTTSTVVAPVGRPTGASCTPERCPRSLPRPAACFGRTPRGVVWSEPVLSGAARAGVWTAHKRVRVRDVGRLVRPSEADPVYLSCERPCLRTNRSRHLKWRILETVSPPCWTHLHNDLSPLGSSATRAFSIDGKRRGPVVSPKQLLTSCFRRLSTARPLNRHVRYETCARVDEGRCRWPSSPSALKQARGEAQPPVDLRARQSRLLLENDREYDCASIAAPSAALVLRVAPVVPWSCLMPSTVHADSSHLEGPRSSTILVETAADRHDACCERAVRLRRHGWRVERASRREAAMSCLTAVLWR